MGARASVDGAKTVVRPHTAAVEFFPSGDGASHCPQQLSGVTTATGKPPRAEGSRPRPVGAPAVAVHVRAGAHPLPRVSSETGLPAFKSSADAPAALWPHGRGWVSLQKVPPVDHCDDSAPRKSSREVDGVQGDPYATGMHTPGGRDRGQNQISGSGAALARESPHAIYSSSGRDSLRLLRFRAQGFLRQKGVEGTAAGSAARASRSLLSFSKTCERASSCLVINNCSIRGAGLGQWTGLSSAGPGNGGGFSTSSDESQTEAIVSRLQCRRADCDEGEQDALSSNGSDMFPNEYFLQGWSHMFPCKGKRVGRGFNKGVADSASLSSRWSLRNTHRTNSFLRGMTTTSSEVHETNSSGMGSVPRVSFI